MASFNKVILIGNLGQDPEVKSIANGGRVANFSVATGRQWTGPGGDKQFAFEQLLREAGVSEEEASKLLADDP